MTGTPATAGAEWGREAVWAHRLALATAAATLVLIFVGGVVTNTGSGLAVPDWPTTFGHNMFLYPPSAWVGGVLYEHSHRLIGSVVGLLTIGLAVALWLVMPRGGIRWLGIVALLAVIVQGALGGLRVVLVQQTLALIHGLFAQAFFGLIVALAVMTSAGWRSADVDPAPVVGARVRRLSIATTGLLFIQIALGVVVTHTGRQLHTHLALGVVAAVHVLWLAARVLRAHGNVPRLAAMVRVQAALLILQVFLGIGAYLARFTAGGAAFQPDLALAFPTVHRLVGSALFGASLMLSLWVSRLSRIPGPVSPGEIPGRETRAVGGPASGQVTA